MLNENKKEYLPDFKDKTIATYGLKRAADSVGMKSSYVIPIFTLDEKFIGCLGMDYVSKEKINQRPVGTSTNKSW